MNANAVITYYKNNRYKHSGEKAQFFQQSMVYILREGIDCTIPELGLRMDINSSTLRQLYAKSIDNIISNKEFNKVHKENLQNLGAHLFG